MERKDLFDIVRVRGADALPFLHSQFAADLMPLGDGQLRWSALLNPQGRVLYVVAALRLAADDWRLLVPFSRGAELLEALRRFVFRRKVALSIEPGSHVALGATGFDSGVDGMFFTLTDQAGEACTDAALDRFVAAGLALIDTQAAGRHLGHALRLERFDAFSVKKGCYPGQEIVARTHFLGRNKRVPVVVNRHDTGEWHSGDVLRDGDVDIGEMVCAGDVLGLAVLTRPVAVGHSLMRSEGLPPVRVTRSFAPES